MAPKGYEPGHRGDRPSHLYAEIRADGHDDPDWTIAMSNRIRTVLPDSCQRRTAFPRDVRMIFRGRDERDAAKIPTHHRQPPHARHEIVMNFEVLGWMSGVGATRGAAAR